MRKRLIARAAVVLSCCASAALPGAACAQAALQAAAGDEQLHLALIEQEQDLAGVTSRALIEPLVSLGQYYISQQDYDLAFDNFAQARQITRVNDGLGTLQELPLIAQLVRIEEARGRFEEAWELEQSLLMLTEENADALEIVPILREVAAKRLQLLELHRTGEIPPQIVLGCYYNRDAYIAAMGGTSILTSQYGDSNESCSAGERNTVRLALLLEARSYKIRALDAMLQNDMYASDEMWELFTDILQSSYTIMPRARRYADTPLANLMMRLLSYEPQDRAGHLRRAQIMLQLADMNVVHSRDLDRYTEFDTVQQQYQQIYESLQRQGMAQAELEALFQPAIPVPLPAFTQEQNWLAEAATMDSGTYVDLSFEVTHQGKPRRIEVIAATEGLERAQRREVEQWIYRTTFRPRLVDGALVNSGPVTLRYYLADAARPAEEHTCADAAETCGVTQ